MSRNFYFDCSSGISGDMTVAALLDLGADREVLEKMIASLQKQGIEGFQVKISRVKKSGMDACDFSVLLDEAHENHDHDMGWLHSKSHEDHIHHGFLLKNHASPLVYTDLLPLNTALQCL